MVGVIEPPLGLCGETLFVCTRSAGTEILRENSVFGVEMTRDFRCLLNCVKMIYCELSLLRIK